VCCNAVHFKDQLRSIVDCESDLDASGIHVVDNYKMFHDHCVRVAKCFCAMGVDSITAKIAEMPIIAANRLMFCPLLLANNSGSLAMFAAIRRAVHFGGNIAMASTSNNAPGRASCGTPTVVLAGGETVFTYLSRTSR